ncbi:undecaprenyldiphospho-muramoylpentapeptide beta-N-acetylglucosaminyltransferase [Kaistia dalseonensis]|uniref:UDP-N-acetylglucosamine--N-acetylmuramyl-(pentapeptide) pyrophosphoryl-undecaprenol N-acetylglucosamine transferase n=1 Tax=Kaistia dalseonensis TaxID=410840 RepID=A0ABU0HD50_9HYPH|nr:undecaprenyldiphospho-muramoylpentapeptide beta-N-acetylglucosaminyltransferase [Kaistia dalseonensis]MCX5497141.1 undecaprenyldiphospho-muramoylpentapeptide beta-N-acetylglucosaminyltransferase [Kaistia dalseonensis]MDQ0439768.1 UDP-N-acetylglucosamine--N-acetylmuramyl-(pentapeptide) pyrophosphoryl-undecaprenol N-acetylglucosamine transferase [Kaistia dalseonensis]
MADTILLCAGGTGGHLFPAEALAHALKRRGWRIDLATDHRAETYGQDFPATELHIIRSATPSVKSPVVMAAAAWSLWRGYWQARSLLNTLKPKAVVGFGGYPTVPPMLAAAHKGIPTIVHDANAVLGRANKLLAPRATVLATSFPGVALGPGVRTTVVQTGNPVRRAVVEASAIAPEALSADRPLRVVIFGGSQGARFFSDLLPEALAKLDPATRARLSLVQQCRPEDMERVRAAYDKLGVSAELAPFFRDMPARIAWSDLVISRSGASTVCELAVIGRPAIMVPLPGAIDQDQSANALVLEKAGGGWVVPQAQLTADRLSQELSAFLVAPGRLVEAAHAARSVGRPDADERLADLVERVVSGATLDAPFGVSP